MGGFVVTRALVAGALAASLALLPSAAAAGVDLKSLLAEPPSSDWVEAGATPTVLDGPFSAETYAAYLQAVGADTAAQAAGQISRLQRYGFAAGYAREWEQRGTQDTLVERVFEFGDSNGAGYWYSDLKIGAQTSSEYAGDIPEASAIPDSFGVVLKSKTDSFRDWRVEFMKANLVFVIHAGSYTDDLSSLAVGQAKTEYGLSATGSPSPSATPSQATTQASSRLPGLLTGAIVATVSLVVIAALIGGGLLLMSRRQRPGARAPGSVHMSPDWAFWWDGAQWQPAAWTTPPAAPRSPDGAYWWDGRGWRPVR
jgi:hypothetical protein